MKHIGRLLIVFIFLMLAGCDYLPFGYTPIGKINRNPGQFEAKEVRVKGEVTHISKLPLLEVKTYTLQDSTGEITVFTASSLPAMNETLAIRATVKSAAIIGKQSFGLRLEETKKLPGWLAGG